MMLYLFVTFQILYSVSSDISCYKTPFDINSFNYIVTADHFPAELQNSSLEVNSVSCYIQVLWQRDPDNTKIALIADNNMKAISTQHQLQVDVGYETKMSSIPTWAKQIIYQCNTNQCNRLSQLKHLLRSLIVNESLHELAYLLNPVKPFHGEWCYRRSNATFENCNTTIPVSLCTQCELVGTMNQTGTESCEACSTVDPDNSLLVYEKTFDITDRTNSSTWAIFCGRKNCNTPAIGDSIRKKSYIDFDFTKFLNNETAV
jgi:hypothetical protein